MILCALLAIVVVAQTLEAQPISDIHAAVTRALPLLQHSAGEFVAKRSCVSCHHNILPILMLHEARNRGFQIDVGVLQSVEDKTFRELRGANALDDAIQATNLNDPTPNDSYLLMAAHEAGLAPDLTLAVYARRLVRWQRQGHWITSDFRPPHSSSVFMATATAVHAIRSYMPAELASERDASLARARQWLLENRPVSTEDAAFRLMGLEWAHAPSDEIARAAGDLRAMQKPSGGWPQLTGYVPDAYSTGEAVYALHVAGSGATDQAWAKGLKFLISTQAKDGTWRTQTRMVSPANVSPKYFSTGFPYVKDEFLSYAGSCWAVMALLSALPSSPPQVPTREPEAVSPSPSWMRTALFGNAQRLSSLLDAGLDPNSRTANGTTVLMAAAPDVEKVRLLLARGTDVKVRPGSGHDALTIAAAYRGTAGSIQTLLAAGATAEPPDGVRVRKSPLVFASMTGDLENVALLLSHGAKASESALSEAVTFGYLDVVNALMAAGADAGIVESSGINLLHWAAITNRPTIIPALAAAHVPIDAMDDNGFTPLMYAATIDFGDVAVMRALLSAGADKTIRNFEDQTPLALARRYQHSRLEAELRGR